jgi:hypothetical protein
MRLPFRTLRSQLPAPLPGVSCRRCAAPLAPGQKWCLECGLAASGAFGLRSGLRSNLGVLGATLLVGLAAGAGAYAALRPGSKPARKPAVTVPARTPAVADLPSSTVPAVTPPTTTVPTSKAPVVARTPTVVSPVKVTPASSAPARPTVDPPKAAPTPTTTAAAPKHTTTKAATATIPLDSAVAGTYNPYGSPAASFGDPAKAIDGNDATAWTHRLDPAAGGRTHVGLAVKLEPEPVGAVTLPATPGMRVEIYGATGVLPPTITDRRWVRVASIDDTAASSTARLEKAGESFDYLLAWIPAAPNATTVRIAELTLTRPSG